MSAWPEDAFHLSDQARETLDKATWKQQELLFSALIRFIIEGVDTYGLHDGEQVAERRRQEILDFVCGRGRSFLHLETPEVIVELRRLGGLRAFQIAMLEFLGPTIH